MRNAGVYDGPETFALHGSSKHATPGKLLSETSWRRSAVGSQNCDLINAQLPIADPDVTAHRWRVFGRRGHSGAEVDKVQIVYARIQFVCSRKRTIVLDGFVIQPHSFGERWARPLPKAHPA